MKRKMEYAAASLLCLFVGQIGTYLILGEVDAGVIIGWVACLVAFVLFYDGAIQ